MCVCSLLIDNVHCNVAPDHVGAWIVTSVSAMAARYGTASPQESKIIEAAGRAVAIIIAIIAGCCMLAVWAMKPLCQRPASPAASSYELVPVMATEAVEAEHQDPMCVTCSGGSAQSAFGHWPSSATVH